jgi:MFS transporter, OFA family, oxalate/formate antiporter
VAARGRIFHGWWIVAAAFVSHAVNVGLMFFAWSVFLTPLAAEFGGRGPVALGYSFSQFAVAGYGLVVGRLVDRRGARPVEAFGACVMALGFSWYRRCDPCPVSTSVWPGRSRWARRIGALPNNTAVARWFVVRRGATYATSPAASARARNDRDRVAGRTIVVLQVRLPVKTWRR